MAETAGVASESFSRAGIIMDRSKRFSLLSLCLGICTMPVMAVADGPIIDSREYKLSLKPELYWGDHAALAASLWESQLKPAIAAVLGDSGKSFKRKHTRRIEFRDTSDCALSNLGISYRQRADWSPESGTEPKVETTLKLRRSDLLLVNAMRFDGPGDRPKSKLEEDISLSGAEGAATAKHRFSYSVTSRKPIDPPKPVLGAVLDIFPGSKKVVADLANAAPSKGETLGPGDAFIEVVYSGGAVELGHKLEAEFDLTFWYPEENRALDKPRIAEISFSYDTENGAIERDTALRIEQLVAVVSRALGPSAVIGGATKTSLALPRGCRED